MGGACTDIVKGLNIYLYS